MLRTCCALPALAGGMVDVAMLCLSVALLHSSCTRHLQPCIIFVVLLDLGTSCLKPGVSCQQRQGVQLCMCKACPVCWLSLLTEA